MMAANLPVTVGWYAPLRWPVKVSSEARYEWWLAWHYVQFTRGTSGPWYLGEHPA